MIIKSIEICNFMSYYEDNNKFYFDADATLIIGQNNTGKSKLFDAYNWVLYNEAYDSAAEDWKSTSEFGEGLANRLAKKNCAAFNRLNVSVSLTFEDDDNNSYIVTRNYRIQKISEEDWNKPADSDLMITKRKAITYDSDTYSGEEARHELNKYFPKNLSRYFLFQGEGISKLLQLSKRSDFTRAISELSGIKYFAKASRYANNVYERLKYEFESKVDSNIEVQKAKIKLANEINDIKDNLNDLKDKLDNEYKERDIKQKVLDDKLKELSRYEECAKLLQEIKSFGKELAEKQKYREVLFEHNRNFLLNSWMYAPMKQHFVKFLQLYRKGKEEQKIPEPIRQDFIQQMLQEHICKVCGTAAPEGSDPYEHIAQHINEKALDREVAIINTLSDTADTMKMAMDHLPDDVSDFKEQLRATQGEIDRVREIIDYKEDELRLVAERIEEEKKIKVDRSDLEKVNLVQLNKDRDRLFVDLEASKGRIDHLAGRMDEIERNLHEKEKESEQLISQSSNEIERKRMQLAGRIKDHAERLHQDFLGKLLQDIEHEANEYFNNMTRTNAALSGNVRVDYKNQEVYTVDEQGRRMTNINQANKVSLQISFVAAVLSVSNKVWEKHFPFVADAPISALGGNNKLSSIKTMIDIFRQSIIIIKDDATTANPESIKNDEVRQLIQKNDKIRHAYELRMSENATTQEDQHSEVLKLK